MTPDRPPLWACPDCGARFVNRNQWHSCGLATLDDWLDGLGSDGRALYDGFEGMIARCGEYHVGPAKTRIAFLGRVRFAGITRLSDSGMRIAFALPQPVQSERFAKVDEVVPGWWVHELDIRDPGQLDDELEGWIRESYRLMGMQGRLA